MSAGSTGASRTHEIVIKAYPLCLPLELGISIISTCIRRLKCIRSDFSMSMSLALKSRFPANSVTAVLLLFGLWWITSYTWFIALSVIWFAFSQTSSGSLQVGGRNVSSSDLFVVSPPHLHCPILNVGLPRCNCWYLLPSSYGESSDMSGLIDALESCTWFGIVDTTWWCNRCINGVLCQQSTSSILGTSVL